MDEVLFILIEFSGRRDDRLCLFPEFRAAKTEMTSVIKLSRKQGDRIGRIFAYCVAACIEQLF
jgi:hypothetical protein